MRTYPDTVHEAVEMIARLEAIARVCGTAAHQLNNQLTAILGYGSLLGDACTEAHVAEHAARLRSAAERAISMTTVMHGLARQQVPLLRELDAGTVIRDVLPTVTAMFPGRSPRCDIADGALPIRTDRSQLEACILAAATNILDHCPVTATPTFGCANLGSRIRISISDDGPGVAADLLPRVVEPFVSTKTDRHAGIGLTSIILGLHRLGGAVTLRSGKNAGFVVMLDLPRVMPSAPET